MKFIIDRKTWLRGEGTDDSFLIRDDGKMCCLGHIGLQCGIPEVCLSGEQNPSAIDPIALPLWPNGIHPIKDDDREGFWKESELANDMMRTNDSTSIDEDEREAALIQLAKGKGIELEFVD